MTREKWLHFLKNQTNVHQNIYFMSGLEKEILVFKTDLISDEKLEMVKPILDEHPGILRWNVDRHDVDKVLRIESENVSANDVIGLLQQRGFLCEELPD